MTDKRFCDGCGEEMQRVNSDIELYYNPVRGSSIKAHLHGHPGEGQRCLLLWVAKFATIKALRTDVDRARNDNIRLFVNKLKAWTT